MSLKDTQLWDQIRQPGFLWHRTSLEGLEGILGSGELLPNDGQFAYSYLQSANGYARRLPAIALFDFETVETEAVLDQEMNWRGFLVGRGPAVLIAIDRKKIAPEDLILPNQIPNGHPKLAGLADQNLMFIPHVEALYLAPIPTAAFATLSLCERPDRGGFRIEHFDTQSSEALFARAKEWQTENDAHVKERHEKGHFTLEEAQNGIPPRGWDLSQLWVGSDED